MRQGILFDNVSLSFGQKAVFKDFSHSFAPGVTTAVSGASGCGKTTLLRLAAGLLKPDSGTISVAADEKITYLFQEDRLLPYSTVLENVMFTGVTRERAMDALDEVGLGTEAQSMPGQLSGGMKRRLAIARAIAYDGTLLLLDEPVRGLDAQTKNAVMHALKRALHGKTALIVTHDEDETEFLAQQRFIIG